VTCGQNLGVFPFSALEHFPLASETGWCLGSRSSLPSIQVLPNPATNPLDAPPDLAPFLVPTSYRPVLCWTTPDPGRIRDVDVRHFLRRSSSRWHRIGAGVPKKLFDPNLKELSCLPPRTNFPTPAPPLPTAATPQAGRKGNTGSCATALVPGVRCCGQSLLFREFCF